MTPAVTKAIERIKASPRTLGLLKNSFETTPVNAIIYTGSLDGVAPLLVDKYAGSTGFVLLQLENQFEQEVNYSGALRYKINDYQKEIIEELRKLKLVHPMRLRKMEEVAETLEAPEEFYKMTEARREEFIAASPLLARTFAKLDTLRTADRERNGYYVIHLPEKEVIVDDMVSALKYVLSTVGNFGGILGDETEIISFLKTQGRDLLPPELPAAQKKKVLAEVALVVQENKLVYPQAYAEIKRQQARGRD